jgi:hypothetical protein
MFMGIYTEAHGVNELHKDLYRLNIPNEFLEDKSYGRLCDLSRWYTDRSVESAYFKYSEEDFDKLFELYIALKHYLNNVDLLVFGSDFDSFDGEFLGYDVVDAKSGLSVIDAVLLRDSGNVLLDIIYDYFAPRINEYGLLKHNEDAIRLIELYNKLKGEYRMNLKTIDNPQLTVIYKASVGEV